MIHPNMATMLCFITTDTDIHPELLDRALHDAVNVSFNMLSVDGDTSTNDMVSIMASGTAQNKKINDFGDGYIAFSTALTALCTEMVKIDVYKRQGYYLPIRLSFHPQRPTDMLTIYTGLHQPGSLKIYQINAFSLHRFNFMVL